jgi:hypothetical protein
MPPSRKYNRRIRLQDRDLAVLLLLGELGHATIKLIRQRFWPDAKTDRSCQNRLNLLVEHGLIHKLELEVSYAGGRSGRPPALFSLTSLGALAVERHTGSFPPRVQRKVPKPATLLHRAEIVDTRLAWDEACKLAGIPSPLWVHEQDRRATIPDNAPPIAHFLLYHAFRSNGNTVTCRPDAATLTLIPDPRRSGQSLQLVTWWEIDRSREGLLQIKGKLPGYRAALLGRAYVQYGWPEVSNPTVRVLWVCPTAERAASVRAAIKDDPVVAAFRFTARSLLDPGRLLTEPIWTDHEGNQRSILRSSPSSLRRTSP